MVWQERTTTIVMLTNLTEGEKVKCELYWPESGKEAFGPFSVTIADQQVFTDYTIRTFKVSVSEIMYEAWYSYDFVFMYEIVIGE